MTGFIIRPATIKDCPDLLSLITELAEYEKMLGEVETTVEKLEATLFGSKPAAEALIAEVAGNPVGFALFFQNYSTFLAKPGIYLEDLYVQPTSRDLGIGKALLAQVAAVAHQRGCGRYEWSVLDWNTPALDFYRAMGAVAMDEWTVQRVSGPKLVALAKHAPGLVSR